MDTNGHECQGRAFVPVKVRLVFKQLYPIGKGWECKGDVCIGVLLLLGNRVSISITALYSRS